MRLLLDTHAVLWWIAADRRLSAPARRAIQAPNHERFVSIAVAWEMAIKSSLGKLRLPMPVGRFLGEHLAPNGMSLMAIALGDVERVERLPFHHRDPFDRLMAAQAVERGLTVVSSDPVFEQYGARRIW
jgi:PIN domain nuclease of toxin-antitoxin system